jgi:hypothetical protein
MTTTAQPKYSTELQTATERALGHADLRCKPGINAETVLDTITANNVKVNLLHGQLVCEFNDGRAVHTPAVIEGLVRDRKELFYPRQTELGGVKSRDELDMKGKLEYLQANGLAAWEKLPQTASSEQVIVLDYNRMTRAQWLSLSRSQKAECLKVWPKDALGAVMARVK